MPCDPVGRVTSGRRSIRICPFSSSFVTRQEIKEGKQWSSYPFQSVKGACSRVNPLVASERGELRSTCLGVNPTALPLLLRGYVILRDRIYTTRRLVFIVIHPSSLFVICWAFLAGAWPANVAWPSWQFARTSFSLSFKSSSIYIYKYKYTFLADRTEQTRFTLIVQSPLSLKKKKKKRGRRWSWFILMRPCFVLKGDPVLYTTTSAASGENI